MEGDQLEALDFPSEALHSEVTVVVTGEPPGAIEEEPENEEEGEATSEVIDVLSLLDVLRVSAVMEDIIDQLSILSYIIPVQYERKQSISQKSSHEGTSMVSSTRKTSLTKERPTVSETKQRGLDFILKKPTRQTMMTLETLKKIQNDRQYFSDVITSAMREMQDSGSFRGLLEALGTERDKKMNFHEAITREEKGRREIKSLQRQLVDVKKERQMQVQNGNEYIAHLKDQLQEMKAKTNLENLYMKRNTELQISQTQKKCNRAEELLLEEIEKLRMRTEEENRVHTDIEMFLKKEQQKLEEKLEFWMEKFDKDTEAKQNELNALKAAKATDLSHLQDLAKTIREYEQVIIEDRMEKEKTRKKMEQDDLELKSIVKLQAWWRGTVVRKEIGGFRMPKKEKDDGKDSKGKEKDKRRGKK
ncbi:dynein regulatory complex protein 9 isoform X1 [Onychomys torridus]|uniref:dynein regulatory complex protein 9 isoform X1 n=1 Tax=Onychomys torridus TaxID=38674 RepID=UPI00167FBB80|nr:dynein regulatory complex protein 9 isoform X1 [Onychomys torridus]XP_036059959.1 dynein regulatory complex protein 9 isoform X1 [Onychomys torridus]XP_036059960.1 dynein regulatory complex protein 9 isoform X1 [Onychomys torridus]XP_036059961.1 dynein regulatory complex protein 9 isoform X1 [Onychomys torridus]XP_036059962.1 dynein regulatory complex protein 9 isoform X1 [Onychomys torridus]